MTIKLVATDMDGTLLNSKHRISEENYQAILALQDAGKEVVLVTGRDVQEAKLALEEFSIEAAVICTNGAYVLDKQGSVLVKHTLSEEKIRKIIEILKHHGVLFEVYTNKGCYGEDYSKDLDRFLKNSASHMNHTDEEILQFREDRLTRGALHEVADFEEMFQDESLEYYKVFARYPEDAILKEIRIELNHIEDIMITSSWFDNLEIGTIEASKGNSLKFYLEHNGYDVSEAMAIGDNFNDISMFEIAGTSVAMGNAVDEIKAKCDHVTGTNDEHGFALAVNKHVFNK